MACLRRPAYGERPTARREDLVIDDRTGQRPQPTRRPAHRAGVRVLAALGLTAALVLQPDLASARFRSPAPGPALVASAAVAPVPDQPGSRPSGAVEPVRVRDRADLAPSPASGPSAPAALTAPTPPDPTGPSIIAQEAAAHA